jgi:50S ribosomal protein L16 3-hydroxylase
MSTVEPPAITVAGFERAAVGNRNGFAFTPEFWEQFAARHWEKTPLLIKQPFATQLVSDAELFNALVDASDKYREEGLKLRPPYDRSIKLRFCIEHSVLMTDIDKHLPDAGDESLEGYLRRIERRLDGREFELIVNQLQSYNFEMWARLRMFFRGLYNLVGIPTENADAAIFIRNQKRTGFGLHKDKASVFMFVLKGRKRMLLWPYEAFSATSENIVSTLDYRQYVSDALVLEGGPGDIIYWPSGYWHIGESDGELSASISVGLRLNYSPFADVIKHLTRMVERQLGASGQADLYSFQPDRLQHTAAVMPRDIDVAVRAVREASSHWNLEQTLKLAWLNRVTGYGFVSVPGPRATRTLADDEIIWGQPEYPVVCTPMDGELVACSANGHSFTLRATPKLEKLIDCLNTGMPRQVASLLAEFATTTETDDRELLRRVLEKLHSLRAIELITPKETERT